MLDFVIFAVTFVLVLIGLVIYLYPGSRKVTTIPGLDPSDPKDGNLADITQAGSLHQFLQSLHDQFGDIASFWFGQKLVVSLASPDLFKEHSKVFDRPSELFEVIEPLVTSDSIQFANGADGRARRNQYDKFFSHDTVKHFYGIYQVLTKDLVKKLETVSSEEHVPLMQYMLALAVKFIVAANFGSSLKDDKEILNFRRSFDIAWTEIESRLSGDEPGPDRIERFDEAKKEIYDCIEKIVKKRKKSSGDSHDKAFIDTVVSSGRPESQVLCDSLMFVVGGFHGSGLLLTWGLYFLASHPDIQDKVYEELIDVIGEKSTPTFQAISQLTYLHQILEETLRCSTLATYTARVQTIDIELGGHKIPSGTPVVHALGVVLQDDRLWPLPNNFDPDRFNPENTKERPEFAFEPFGFAGRRKCPGHKFAYAEATVVFAMLLQKFKFKMVPGQVVAPVYGLVTKPGDEIWVTVEKR